MELNIFCSDDGVDDGFGSPVNSRWVVAVGGCGTVVIIERPNIHFSFFDNGSSTEDIGLPPDTNDGAGIYEWICSPSYSTDWESGYTEFVGFDVVKSRNLDIDFD